MVWGKHFLHLSPATGTSATKMPPPFASSFQPVQAPAPSKKLPLSTSLTLPKTCQEARTASRLTTIFQVLLKRVWLPFGLLLIYLLRKFLKTVLFWSCFYVVTSFTILIQAKMESFWQDLPSHQPSKWGWKISFLFKLVIFSFQGVRFHGGVSCGRRWSLNFVWELCDIVFCSSVLITRSSGPSLPTSWDDYIGRACEEDWSNAKDDAHKRLKTS